MVKSYNSYNDEYARLFPRITKTKSGTGKYHCKPCNQDYNLVSGGKSAIEQHIGSEKHKQNVKALEKTQCISAIFPDSTAKWTDVDLKCAAAEGAWAFHVARHHQSFLSTNCLSSDGLFRAMFPDSAVAKKFKSARTKTTAIIKGVLAPHSVKMLMDEIGEQPYAVLNDASNHHETKMFPFAIRFFTRAGLRNRLLDFESLPGETADQIFQYLEKMLEKHHLKWTNMTSYCADNAPINFGGERREGQKNVFAKLQARTSQNLLPIGSSAHLLHKLAEKACDSLSIRKLPDIESIVLKICAHFNSSTTRTEGLKEFCDFVKIEYANFINRGLACTELVLKG